MVQLLQGAGASVLAGTAGCIDWFGGEPGVKFALQAAELAGSSVPDEHALVDFDSRGVSDAKTQILEEATATGEYVEDNVNWDAVPNRTTISPAFRDLLLTLCDASPDCTHPMNREWTAYFEHDATQYRAVIHFVSSGP